MKFITQSTTDPEHRGSIALNHKAPMDSSDSNHIMAESEPRCMEYLRRWASGKNLLVASFYFWASGSKLQTTRTGLYRTLLHQLLSKRPELLPVVSPDRWGALCLFGHGVKPLKEYELRDMLQRLLSELASTSCVCLFIDGLDEFEGKQDELVLFLKQLMAKTPIKMCVSSRPWPVFEDAFQNKPSLRVEDLTYHDIKSFDTSNFQSDANFSRLKTREPQFAGELVDEIVWKASGVFLWVQLVVSSLLDGMRSEDRVADLRRRLDSLPPDIEDLYDKILDDLDPFYFEHAAQYFQMMKAWGGPPPALLVAFADESIEFILELPLQNQLPEDLEIRIETMQRRVNSRCKGLLEVFKGAGSRLGSYQVLVQYLHRTVKDYIEGAGVQEKLLNRMHSTFDPKLSLCSGAWGVFKTGGGGGFPYLFSFLASASQVSTKSVPDMMRLLDDADTRISSMPPTTSASLWKYCSRSARGTVAVVDVGEVYFKELELVDSLQSLAVREGVVEYVRRRTPDQCLVATTERKDDEIQKRIKISHQNNKSHWGRLKTLARNISGPTQSRSQMWPLLLDIPSWTSAKTLSMTAMLLDKGADPNYTAGTLPSVWVYILAILLGVYSQESWDPLRKELYRDIASLLLAHGARIDRKTIQSAVDLMLTGSSINFDLVGIDRKAMVSMTRQTLREMRDKGDGLNFPVAYSLQALQPLEESRTEATGTG